jgi:hypothetical protein
MSRRRRANPDSLELLLDTMCNTFGGIIMIALLIALLSRDASSDTSVAQRREAVEKQIEATRQQAAEAEQLQKRLERETNPETAATLALLTERDKLRRQIESAQQLIQSNSTLMASAPATVDSAEAQRLAAEKETKTVEARTLTERIERENQGRQRQLRLPRERATGKKTFYFIARYGKIYPVHVMREGRREINAQELDWSATPNGETAKPRRDSGIDAATGLPALARFFNEVPNATYSVHFLVYDDSFPGFLAARQIPLQRGYDVGWEFLPEDRPINFSSRGEAPPAL